jgi:signal transduction protein with GAF and PtsI domain/anti-sigma regulatory factor (Ser/Thr protein kinase)
MRGDAPDLIGGLRAIAHALSAAWDLDSTLDLIARTTAQVMQADSCSIYLLDPDGETLWLRASTGLRHKALGRAALKLGEGLTGWAAQQGAAVAVRDAQHDPRFKFLPITGEREFESLAAVPLANRGKVIGALNVQTHESHDFSADALELLSLISDLAAGALDRASLYDHMHRQIDELTTLAKVSETITAPIYLDEMLALVAEMAAKAMGAAQCALWLIDAERGELVLRAAAREEPVYRALPALKLDTGVAGTVVRERRPATLADVRSDPQYPFGEAARAGGLVALLCVPLVVREHVIGVFNCYTAEAHRFGDDEIALFSTLANQAALAIENAQLVTRAAVVREMHHRIKNNLQTVAMLLRLQAGSGTALSAQDVLHTSVNRILSIAAVHEVLAQQGFRLVDVKDVCERIAQVVAQNMLRPDLQATISVEGEALVLPSRPATSLALAVNELLQNALEHAFVGRMAGTVRIVLGRAGADYVVEVTDDGVGLPAEGPAASLGLEIVETLVREDLRGRLAFHGTRRGTQVVVRFPRSIGDT